MDARKEMCAADTYAISSLDSLGIDSKRLTDNAYVKNISVYRECILKPETLVNIKSVKIFTAPTAFKPQEEKCKAQAILTKRLQWINRISTTHCGFELSARNNKRNKKAVNLYDLRRTANFYCALQLETYKNKQEFNIPETPINTSGTENFPK